MVSCAALALNSKASFPLDQSGIEYRDSSFVLNARNERRIPLNSVFVVSVGFSDVSYHRSSGKKGTFSVLLCDTVLASKDGPKNLCTTDPNYKQVRPLKPCLRSIIFTGV